MVIESLSCVEFWLILLLTRIDLCKKIDKYVLHRNWSKFWQRTLNWLITYRTIHYYILTEMSTSSTYIFKFELSLWFRIFIRISLQDWNNFDMTAIPQYLKEFFLQVFTFYLCWYWCMGEDSSLYHSIHMRIIRTIFWLIDSILLKINRPLVTI